MTQHLTLRQLTEDPRFPWLTMRYARRLIHERRLPYSKVGGRVLVDPADLDRLIEAGRNEARAS